MGLKLLFNTIGETATALASNLTIRDECDLYDVIGGHRSRQVETSTTGTQWNLDFTLPASKTLDHLVISNADIFTTSKDPKEIEILYGATFSTSSLITSLATLNTSLAGIETQDVVIAHTRASDKFRIAFKNNSESTRFRTGKVYLCEAFDFGGEIPLIPSSQAVLRLSDENKFPCVRGLELYTCEYSIVLVYRGLSYSDLTDFEAKPLHQPFFLYDESDDLFSTSIEHVICESYTESREAHNTYSLELNLKRLKHYEL